MDFSSILGSIGSAVGSSTFNNLVNLGTSAFDIYSGINSMNNANKMYDVLYANADKQDAWATEQQNRMKSLYWPYEDLQYQYATEDTKAMRDSSIAQRDYNIQRIAEQIAQAKEINPLLDTTEKSLLNTLTQDSSALANRYRTEALGDVSQSFAKSRSTDLRKMAQMGINPASGAAFDYTKSSSIAEALANANALTQANRKAEDTAINRQGQALNYRMGIAMPTYTTTPSVSAGNVSSSLSGAGSTASSLASAYDQAAQSSFTGASTALNNMYWNPITTKAIQSKYGFQAQ